MTEEGKHDDMFAHIHEAVAQMLRDGKFVEGSLTNNVLLTYAMTIEELAKQGADFEEVMEVTGTVMANMVVQLMLRAANNTDVNELRDITASITKHYNEGLIRGAKANFDVHLVGLIH